MISAEEMAILNALIYVETGQWDENGKKLIDIIEQLESEDSWQPGGGMGEEECRALFRAVKNSPELCQLELFQVEESVYEESHVTPSDSRVLTFKNGDLPIVIFRGTEGDAETKDNLIGAVQTDTEAQKRALDYINILHDRYGFEQISVSGHSKGGNKAMYVTVLSDYVTDCTAFDAQGFSAAFLEKYQDQIETVRDRITLIAPDRGVVNALLFSISGTTIYHSTDGQELGSSMLGPFIYHKPNLVFTVDEYGEVHFRDNTNRSELSWVLNGFTESLSLLLSGAPADAAFFQKMTGAIADGYLTKNKEILSNWLNGVNFDGSLALSTQIGNFFAGIFPGLFDQMNGLLTSTFSPFDPADEPGVSMALQFLSESMPFLAAGLSSYAATIWLVPGVQAIGVGAGLAWSAIGLGIASFCQVILGAAVFAAAAWGTVKLLELVLPMLLNAGISVSKAVSLALGMAASWAGEKLTEIGKAAADGFQKVLDEIGRMGGLIADAVKAVKEAVGNFIGNFVSNMMGFFQNMAEGAAAWIGTIFGSNETSIRCAQDLMVTMTRISEIQRQIAGLLQRCTDLKWQLNRAYSVTESVYGFYKESYIRSCCRDIQYNLKCAQKKMDLAEQRLDRNKKALASAVEAYRRADQDGVRIIRGSRQGGWA